MDKVCSSCNTENIDEAKFCRKCGALLDKKIISNNEDDTTEINKIYEKIADELSNNIRKEGLWLRAIQYADGDKTRALSLYTKYRSEELRKEQAEHAEELLTKIKFEADKENARKFHKNGGFTKLFKKELEEKGYKIENDTILTMRLGLFDVKCTVQL